MKAFNHWKRQEVSMSFGIKEVREHPLLEAWLQSKCDIPEEDTKQLKKLQLLLRYNVDLWNEMELKMKFLGPLLALIDYDTSHYRAFMERPIITKLGDKTASGTVDFLIAKGWQIPYCPFFSIHEYKPDPTASKDPLGQLLIAMVGMYQQNQEKDYNFPLYGVYVVGRSFYFVVFDGKKYAKSLAYDATKDEIFEIYCFLKQVKVYINGIVDKEEEV